MYELMIIAKSGSADEVFGKVEKFLKDIDAVSIKSEKLGKKVLAYPIAKQTEGDYFLYNFEAETQALKGLADKIRLEQEAILRHMLIKAAKAPKVKESLFLKNQKAKGIKVLKASIEEKVEEEKIRPKVTVTTRTKVSNVSKVKEGLFSNSRKAKAKADVASKNGKKAVKSKKKGKK